MESERGYQHGFASRSPSMYDAADRERKARTMLAVLREHCGALDQLSVLTVGSSAGIIDNTLARHVGRVTAIDIDVDAIEHARRSHVRDNLSFQVGDAMRLEFPEAAFDVVICAQVYEHVPDAARMMSEIRRVLRPGGVCYFSANNRLIWREPHYGLPLLSWLPQPLADRYLRIARGIPRYYERHFTHRGLRKLVRGFEVLDYTVRIVADPARYDAAYLVTPGSLKWRAALFLLRYFYWLSPGYVWLLEKPKR